MVKFARSKRQFGLTVGFGGAFCVSAMYMYNTYIHTYIISTHTYMLARTPLPTWTACHTFTPVPVAELGMFEVLKVPDRSHRPCASGD